MSGASALAAARRRRAIPQKPEQNEVMEAPKLQPQNSQPLAANPMSLLLKHNQLIASLQSEIETLKRELSQLNVHKNNKDDKESLEYYKNQHAVLLDEMREVKKTLLKVQTFSMETNLELMKLKKTAIVTKQDSILDIQGIDLNDNTEA